MNLLLFLHLIFLGFWGGIVLVEMILEFSLRKDNDQKNLIAQLHYGIDLYAEVPVLFGVLISGLLLIETSHFSSVLYLSKVIGGILPVIINVLCVILVIKRKQASDRGDTVKMEYYTKLVFLAFASGFPLAMVALGLGMKMLGIL